MHDRLRNIIETMKIIDDHGHPGFAMYFSELPEDRRIPFATDEYKTPEESCGGFPFQRELHYESYASLYGFERSDIQDLAKRNELAAIYNQKRLAIADWIDDIMDQAGVEVLMANIALPEGLKNKANIRFVPSVDPLVFPFDNSYLKKRPLSKYFLGYFEYSLAELKMKFQYKDDGFDSYLVFIDHVLESYLQENSAAFKFAMAYARDTSFERINMEEGPGLYEAAKDGDQQAYTKLQDLFVWYIMRKIVKYDMAVQFHFAITDNYVNYFDPLNLSNMLEDEELKNAKIIILHGGYPRYGSAEILALGGLTPNNVCIDISGRIMFANHPKVIAKMLRGWLEKPILWDKIIYGSDVLWGERYIYTCAKTGRAAVYFALSGMIDEDIIDEDTAIVIARKILRENAIRIYNL